MNKLSTGDFAIGAPNSSARDQQWDEIAKRVAIARLDLPFGHDYGKDSAAAKFVEAFVEGARWQREKL